VAEKGHEKGKGRRKGKGETQISSKGSFFGDPAKRGVNPEKEVG